MLMASQKPHRSAKMSAQAYRAYEYALYFSLRFWIRAASPTLTGNAC
jgi:hypothetical protein